MKKRRPQPYMPAPYEDVDIMSIKAVAAGNANSGQQQRALHWIIETLCGTYDQPYRPGEGGDRDTSFACGKQHVGQQVVKLIKMPMAERPPPTR